MCYCVSSIMWGTEPRVSARAASILNLWAISPLHLLPCFWSARNLTRGHMRVHIIPLSYHPTVSFLVLKKIFLCECICMCDDHDMACMQSSLDFGFYFHLLVSGSLFTSCMWQVSRPHSFQDSLPLPPVSPQECMDFRCIDGFMWALWV